MKRLILLLLAYAVGGAIINVAVAWGCEYGAVYPLQVSISGEVAESPLPIYDPSVRANLTGVTGKQASTTGCSLYELFAFHHEFTELGSIRYADQFKVWQAGWPYRSVHGWSASGRPPLDVGSHGLWQLRWLSPKHSPGARLTLPFRPLWPGFAINTIFYAAIIRGLWLLFAAPGFVRRRLRARRGQCPACAYPVGESEVCTECGKPVRTQLW